MSELAWEWQGKLWWTLVFVRRKLVMATVLSLPRLPVAPAPLSAAAAPKFHASPCGFCNFRLPIWSSSASDRMSLSCNVVDSASSFSWNEVDRNVGLDHLPDDEQDACTTSGGEDALLSRREVILNATAFCAVSLATFSGGGEALARDRRNRKEIPAEDYLTSGTGLKYFDVQEGKGPLAAKGETVMVHFDCVYRSITAVSSRESKLLAGNRTIAEPYEVTVGAEPGRERKRDFVENANGLFSAQAAPKPPPALYSITEGMRVGGRRTVIVPPEFGYGQKGINEIPPGATFDLNIELLEVKKPETSSK